MTIKLAQDGNINFIQTGNTTDANSIADLRITNNNTAGTTFITITTVGNIGIGTTQPRAGLEIRPQTGNTSGLMLYSGQDDAGINRVIFNHSNDVTSYLKTQIQTKAIGSGQSARADFAICLNTETNSNNATFAHHRLFISGSSGFIGIGTTTTQNLLDLRPGNATGNISLDPGTSSPGPTNNFMQLCFNGGYNGGETRVNSSKTRYRMYCEQRSTNDILGFDTYSSANTFSTVLGISAGANFGIGTSTPTYKLQVNGTSYFNNGAGHSFLFHKTGNLDHLPGVLVQQRGDNSWGMISEFRTIDANTNRPSIGFSSYATSTTWSLGYIGNDDHFRISQNHGHRHGGWGTERLRINTDGTLYFNNNTYHYGKIIVQNVQDGGSSRGIYMWTDSDTNWGIYMGTAGGGRSLSGGTATSGVYGFTGHAIRFRVYNNHPNGFIFENHSEEHLMSIRGDDGHVFMAGNVTIGRVSPEYTLDVDGGITARDWFRVVGGQGLFWQSYGRGIWSADSAGASYGNVSTYGGGINTWNGYDINGRYTFMANGDTVGFHDKNSSWALFSTNRAVNIPVNLQIGDKYPNVPAAKLYIRCDSGSGHNGGTANYAGRGIRINNNAHTGFWDITHKDTGDTDLVFVYSYPDYAPQIKCVMRAFGNNVTLNFTGQHRSHIQNHTYKSIQDLVGLIVVADKNEYIKMSGGTVKGKDAITISEALPIVSLCTTEEDKKCFGVICMSEDPETREDTFGNISTPYPKEKGDTRAFINAIGEGAIWVTNKNGSLESGDYITSSSIPGYGMRQESNRIRSCTVAKITMDCDFTCPLKPKYKIKKLPVETQEQNINENSENAENAGPSYTPPEYIQENQGENAIDENGNLIWEEELDENGNVIMIESYNIRYLLPNGTQIEKTEYDQKLLNNEEVYIAAFVGCTYHCG